MQNYVCRNSLKTSKNASCQTLSKYFIWVKHNFFYDGYFYISDTDSLAFGLCKEFEYIIKNGKENQWREAEERWFCKVGYSMISYIC